MGDFAERFESFGAPIRAFHTERLADIVRP
jgi:hypothetical protein